MTLQHRVKELLEREPDSRERKNRYRAVWFIISQIYRIDTLDKNLFITAAPVIESVNRIIRKIQEMEPHLRGTDYQDGKKLSEEKMLELGYEPRYREQVKKLSTL